MRTANIVIENGMVQIESSVLGAINSPLQAENCEVIDAVWMHLATDQGVLLISCLQYFFNGQEFANTTEAMTYINTISND